MIWFLFLNHFSEAEEGESGKGQATVGKRTVHQMEKQVKSAENRPRQCCGSQDTEMEWMRLETSQEWDKGL